MTFAWMVSLRQPLFPAFHPCLNPHTRDTILWFSQVVCVQQNLQSTLLPLPFPLLLLPLLSADAKKLQSASGFYCKGLYRHTGPKTAAVRRLGSVPLSTTSGAVQ